MSNNSKLKTKNYKLKTEAGVSLYLALMVMSLMLGIAFGISTLLIDQFVSLRGAGFSSLAMEAADAGIEKIFYDDRKGIDVLSECPVASPCNQTLSNGATYAITVVGPGVSGCPSSGVTYCAKSLGSYQGAQRAIRIAR